MSPTREGYHARRASSAYRTAGDHGHGQLPATGTSILSIGRATPALRLTQEQSLAYAGYSSARIRRIFLNTGIAYRHFYFRCHGLPPSFRDFQSDNRLARRETVQGR